MENCQNRLVEKCKNENQIEKQPGSFRFDVAGHSLGGNRAQRLAAELPELISTVYTFQSPGVGDEQLVNKFEGYRKGVLEANPKATPGVDFPVVVHIRTEGDIVPKAGGNFLKGDYIIHLRRIDRTLGKGEVHSALSLSEDVELYSIEGKHHTEIGENKSRWEIARKKLGPLVSWLLIFFMADREALLFEKRLLLKAWLGEIREEPQQSV